MKKIPSLFKRDYQGNRQVYNEVVEGSEWALAGEGIATEKHDGTSCMIRDGKLYKRYELKKGKKAPEGFEAAQEPDPVTGDIPGWVPVGDEPDSQWHREGLRTLESFATNGLVLDGTYELVGPKIQGNPYDWGLHRLIRHGVSVLTGIPFDFEGIKNYLFHHEIEGIVWHHPDGRMVKIKRKDFGFRWPPRM